MNCAYHFSSTLAPDNLLSAQVPSTCLSLCNVSSAQTLDTFCALRLYVPHDHSYSFNHLLLELVLDLLTAQQVEPCYDAPKMDLLLAHRAMTPSLAPMHHYQGDLVMPSYVIHRVDDNTSLCMQHLFYFYAKFQILIYIDKPIMDQIVTYQYQPYRHTIQLVQLSPS